MKEMAQKWKDKIWEGDVLPLAPSTVASKIAKGSPFPDQPLIDTMLMIESIESGVDIISETEVRGWVAVVHPDRADIAIRHEYGLGPPERPTLRPTIDENYERLQDEIFDKVFNSIKEVFLNG